jgi:hypothetical protein
MRLAPKQTKDFCPVGFFVCEEPSEQQNKTRTGKIGKTHLMYSLIQLRRLIPLVLVCLALLPLTYAQDSQKSSHFLGAPSPRERPAAPAPRPHAATHEASPLVVPPPDGAYGGSTAEGHNALHSLTSGGFLTAIGWESLASDTTSSFSTGVGAGTLALNNADENTATGAGASLLNISGVNNTSNGALSLLYNEGGQDNTAVGDRALQNNDIGLSGNGDFNDAVGSHALFSNDDGFSNNALGESALFFNIHGAANTAVGDLALESNDFSEAGTANFNTAVGDLAMFNNDGGGQNTVVGAGAGPNLIAGFSNTYVGQFVGDFSGTPIPDESLTIRIADFSIDGFGSAECYIGGIWNNLQPVGGTVVQVTLDLSNDHLGYDFGPNQQGRSAPQRGSRLQQAPARPQHQAKLNDKVEQLGATVARQQKQIQTLTAQLREQAAQIQKVSAQVEMIKPAPQVVENR